MPHANTIHRTGGWAGLVLLLLLSACDRPAATPAPAPKAVAAPDFNAEIAAAWTLERDREASRFLDARLPLRKGAPVGLARLDGVEAVRIPDADAARWAAIGGRLAGRFGTLTPMAPLAEDMAAAATLAPDPPLAALRRAAAMQGFEYLLTYRVTPRAGREAPTLAEAVLLDVRTGAILGSVQAEGEGPDAGAALDALGPKLEDLARALDVQSMRLAPISTP